MQYYKLYTLLIEHTMFAYIDKRYNKVESILTNKEKFLVIRRVEYGRNKNKGCCLLLVLVFGSYYRTTSTHQREDSTDIYMHTGVFPKVSLSHWGVTNFK